MNMCLFLNCLFLIFYFYSSIYLKIYIIIFNKFYIKRVTKMSKLVYFKKKKLEYLLKSRDKNQKAKFFHQFQTHTYINKAKLNGSERA